MVSHQHPRAQVVKVEHSFPESQGFQNAPRDAFVFQPRRTRSSRIEQSVRVSKLPARVRIMLAEEVLPRQ